VSILSTFYAQILLKKITNAQKRHSSLQSLFVLLGPSPEKATCKMLVKSTPSVNFINSLQAVFAPEDLLRSH